jgi:hypothetical protein
MLEPFTSRQISCGDVLFVWRGTERKPTLAFASIFRRALPRLPKKPPGKVEPPRTQRTCRDMLPLPRSGAKWASTRYRESARSSPQCSKACNVSHEVDIARNRSFPALFRSTIFRPYGKTYVSHRSSGRPAYTVESKAGFLLLFRTKEIQRDHPSSSAQPVNARYVWKQICPQFHEV